jgi:glutamine synthetase
VLAGILGVGHRGIRDGAVLNIRDCNGAVSAAAMGEEARRAMGITQRMPLTWEEARELFIQDVVIREVLGDELVNKFKDVNEVSERFIHKTARKSTLSSRRRWYRPSIWAGVMEIKQNF